MKLRFLIVMSALMCVYSSSAMLRIFDRTRLFGARMVSNTKLINNTFRLASAVDGKNAKTVRLLLQQGVNPDSRVDGKPVLLTAIHRVLSTCDKKKAMDVLRILLVRGANPNIRNESDDSTPLHSKGILTDPATSSLLLEQGADLRARNAYGCTPIMLCDTARACHLLRSIDLNEPDADGDMILHDCYRRFEMERELELDQPTTKWARCLVMHGANMNARNREGLAPREVASKAFSTRPATASFLGDLKKLETVKRNEQLYLFSCGKYHAIRKKFNAAWSAIQEALATDKIDGLEDVDFTCFNEYSTSLLHLAVRRGDLAAVRFLIKKSKQKLGPAISCSDGQGLTPLHWALYAEDSRIFYVLFDAERPSECLIKQLLDTAHDIGNQEVIEILKTKRG